MMDVLYRKRAAAQIVSKIQNFKHKQLRMVIAQEMLTTFNDDPDLLKNVVTGDELWMYCNHPNGSVRKRKGGKSHVKRG